MMPLRANTPLLLQMMNGRPVGDLLVRRNEIIEPLTGCRVAGGFPNMVSAVNAALRMNDVADWLGVLKTRAAGGLPNCQDELRQIAENFGGKLSDDANKRTEDRCAEIVAAVEHS
jgi:hypothetical protein